MRKLTLCLILILVCACEVPPEGCSGTVYETAQDQVDQNTGLKLTPSRDMYIDFNEMKHYYSDMETCLGMTATGPSVTFDSFKRRGIGGSWGVYIYVNQLVLINTDDNVAPRDCVSDTEALKHEFVHHILYMNGIPDNHGPEFECARGVNVCNGKPC